MAITIKKKNKPSYSFMEDLVEQTIQDKLFNSLKIKRKSQIKFVEYFLIFGLCDVTKEKIVTSICARIKTRTSFESIDIREIELLGVTIVEFLDYLDINGANVIDKSIKFFDVM
jgi:hypothetical protein